MSAAASMVRPVGRRPHADGVADEGERGVARRRVDGRRDLLQAGLKGAGVEAHDRLDARRRRRTTDRRPEHVERGRAARRAAPWPPTSTLRPRSASAQRERRPAWSAARRSRGRGVGELAGDVGARLGGRVAGQAHAAGRHAERHAPVQVALQHAEAPATTTRSADDGAERADGAPRRAAAPAQRLPAAGIVVDGGRLMPGPSVAAGVSGWVHRAARASLDEGAHARIHRTPGGRLDAAARAPGAVGG